MRMPIALVLGLACAGSAGCVGPGPEHVTTRERGEVDVVRARAEAEARMAEGDRLLRAAQQRPGARLDRAIQAYQAALRLDPLLADAHLRLATCFYLAQEHELEQAQYLKCLAIHPRHVVAWQRLGHARLALDDLQGAREAYERVLALDPTDEVVLFNLHLVEADLGHDDRARELLERVHELARERRPELVSPD